MLTAPVLAHSMRASIVDLEARMRACPDQLHLPPEHSFSPGLYARTIHIPKGAVAVGEIHTQPHLNIVHGSIEVMSDEHVFRIEGFRVFPSGAGAKKVVHALEDTSWTTVHATDETDITVLEATLTAPDMGYVTIGGAPCRS